MLNNTHLISSFCRITYQKQCCAKSEICPVSRTRMPVHHREQIQWHVKNIVNDSPRLCPMWPGTEPEVAKGNTHTYSRGPDRTHNHEGMRSQLYQLLRTSGFLFRSLWLWNLHNLVQSFHVKIHCVLFYLFLHDVHYGTASAKCMTAKQPFDCIFFGKNFWRKQRTTHLLRIKLHVFRDLSTANWIIIAL